MSTLDDVTFQDMSRFSIMAELGIGIVASSVTVPAMGAGLISRLWLRTPC